MPLLRTTNRFCLHESNAVMRKPSSPNWQQQAIRVFHTEEGSNHHTTNSKGGVTHKPAPNHKNLNLRRKGTVFVSQRCCAAANGSCHSNNVSMLSLKQKIALRHW